MASTISGKQSEIPVYKTDALTSAALDGLVNFIMMIDLKLNQAQGGQANWCGFNLVAITIT
jgi:hypothetical protein